MTERTSEALRMKDAATKSTSFCTPHSRSWWRQMGEGGGGRRQSAQTNGGWMGHQCLLACVSPFFAHSHVMLTDAKAPAPPLIV